MSELNNNGRSQFDQSQYQLFDEPGKLLAYNTLKLIFEEPRYSYKMIEKPQFGDIELYDSLKGITYLIEVECREPWQHKDNMRGRFPDVNITLKNKTQQLRLNGTKGFCISFSKSDLGKPFASEFYISKLSDLTDDVKGHSPNYRSKNEMFYKLKNHQVVKWVFDLELNKYIKLNNYKPREYKHDYFN